MRHVRLFLTVVVAALFIVSAAYAEEPTIEITDAFTTDYFMQEVVTEFTVFNPVVYKVDYTITGKPNRRYRAMIKIRSLGDVLMIVQRHLPGDYTVNLVNLVGADDAPGPYTVRYLAKLKKGGVLDVDRDTSGITVLE